MVVTSKVKKSINQVGGNVVVASESYKDPSARDREITIAGKQYIIDDNYNKRDFVAYKNPESGDTYLGIRGTDVTKKKKGLDDLWEDAQIATGIEKLYVTTRNAKAQRLTEQLIKEAGGDKSKVHLSAHSLGSTVALNTGKKYGVSVDAYNPGSSPLQLWTNLKSILKTGKNDLTRIYSTGVDPISATAYYLFPASKKIKLPWTASDPHSLSNFNSLIPEQTSAPTKKKKKT